MLSVLSSCRFVFMESPDPSLVLLCEIGSTEVVFDLNNARGLYLLSMVILSASEEQNIIQLTSRLQLVSTKATRAVPAEELIENNFKKILSQGLWSPPEWHCFPMRIVVKDSNQHDFEGLAWLFLDLFLFAQQCWPNTALLTFAVVRRRALWQYNVCFNPTNIDWLIFCWKKNIQHFRQHFGACYSRFQQCPAFWAPVCCCATVAREPSSHKANSGGLIRKLIVQWNTRDTETMQTKKF